MVKVNTVGQDTSGTIQEANRVWGICCDARDSGIEQTWNGVARDCLVFLCFI